MSITSRFAVPALILLTLLSYAGVFQNDFVNFDDDRYVTQNDTVLRGLTLEGIQYAFTTTRTGNWIPLTWLSLELDVSLFGVRPQGFHATNLVLHLTNVLLFYLLLMRLGGTVIMAFVGAALFAIHPLHVESVAWLSERKDVLSTLFLLWACLRYVEYTKNPHWKNYAYVTALLALGLLAKPMLVTLPVLFLFADLFLLNRFNRGATEHQTSVRETVRSLLRLGLEKVPLFLVVLLVSAITMFAQKSDLAFLDYSVHPLSARIANALCSYVWYLQKTFVPTDLCIFYPLEYGVIDVPRTCFSAVILAALTLFVISQRNRRPYLLFGWGWYLVSLLPVIGIFQVGGQAHADRFTYVPHLGLFLAATWLLCDLVKAWSIPRMAQWALAGMTFALLSGLTVQQVAIWRNSVTLWTHANAVAADNWMARFYLGIERLRDRDWPGARDFALQSLQIRPYNADALALVGKACLQEEEWDEAQIAFQKALEIQDRHRDSLIGLAAVCHGKKRLREAERFLRMALEKNPIDSFVQLQLGLLLAQRGDSHDALLQLQAVTRQAPWQVAAWKAAGQLLARAERFEESSEHFQTALRLAPDDAESLAALKKLSHLQQRTFSADSGIQQTSALQMAIE